MNELEEWDGYISPSVLSRPHHQRDRKAVVALAANRLQRGGANARLSGQHLVQATHALDAGILAGGVDDFAIADDVVDDDNAAWARKFQRPGEIVRVAGLVRIDK